MRARYQAERARYWAERQAISFSLEADPKIRKGYYQTGLAYIEVAQRADPSQVHGKSDPKVMAELSSLQAWGRIQAGDSFLRAGRFDLAEVQLRAAQDEGPIILRRQAALLRAESARTQERWEDAISLYEDFYSLMQGPPVSASLDPQILRLPLVLVQDLYSNADSSLTERGRMGGHRFYAWVEQQWQGKPTADRAAFLDHRLDIAAHKWKDAERSLSRYESRQLATEDRLNALFDRAEILAHGLNQPARADSLYSHVIDEAQTDNLRALAKLRRAEILVMRNRRQDAMRALDEVVHDFPDHSRLAAAALLRQSELLLDRSDWSNAQKTLRRLIQRYPDTAAGLAAPMRMVDIQRERGNENSVTSELRRALHQYQRLISGHASAGAVGIEARERAVDCLLALHETEDALRQLEQIHHILGRRKRGGEALLRAAEIARDEMKNPRLSRLYLEWVDEQVPGSRAALRAREMMKKMGIEPKSGS
jgi:tetratricopeptide (TPR) repeat protein